MTRFRVEYADLTWFAASFFLALVMVSAGGYAFRWAGVPPFGGWWVNNPVPVGLLIAIITSASTLIWRWVTRWALGVQAKSHSHPTLEARIEALYNKLTAHMEEEELVQRQIHNDISWIRQTWDDLRDRVSRVEGRMINRDD